MNDGPGHGAGVAAGAAAGTDGALPHDPWLIASHRVLHGHGLPARWAGRERFVVLGTGMGQGHGFLAWWQAWRADPERCERLCVVQVAAHPPSPAELEHALAASPWPELATALLQAWPPPTRNLHLLDFDAGRVQLILAVGEPGAVLSRLRLEADAIDLEGLVSASGTGTPARTLQAVKAVARLAAPGATLASAENPPGLQAALATAGFVARAAPGQAARPIAITTADWRPRHAPRRPPPLAVQTHEAVVVGAGLAGAAMAQALRRQGLGVTVFEAAAVAAGAASGNPAGLFHGTVNPDDGPHARLFRAAALAANVAYRHALASGRVAGQAGGLLRLADAGVPLADLQAQLQRLGLPAGYVQALDATAATQQAGVTVQHACWHFPQGGWLSPPDWVRETLSQPGITLRTGAAVAAVQRDGDHWLLLDARQAVLARSRLLVLACAAGTAELLRPLGAWPWPLGQSRGQVTHWSCAEPTALRLPIAGSGYALPLPGGLLCGATRQPGDLDATVRQADHLHNLDRLQRLTGLHAPADPALWQGRVGWRLHTDDRLPIAGAMPLLGLPAGSRQDQARLLPRERGLFVLTALGARGLTVAPLLARLVAAQATGAPWPLEQDLADAVDPARWIVRAARRAGAQPG